MKNLHALLFFLFTATTVLAKNPENNFAATDSKALAIPAAQTTSSQQIADYMKANFATDADRVRGIFIWVAKNMSYDLDNMFALNFHESQEDKALKALKNRKGICENYAALFDEICRKAGLTSEVIPGYTRQNGFTSFTPHVWCAVIIDNNWQLFDPTWGSGYVDDKKFTPKINNKFFMAKPSELLKTHMPFDPMWQMYYHPISNADFSNDKTADDKTKPFFSYVDTIRVYRQLDDIAQHEAEARRLEKNGVNNAMIYDRLAHLRNYIEVKKHNRLAEQQNAASDIYNDAVNDYNTSVNLLNKFINYRNAQFKPSKSDADIQRMVDSADNRLRAAKRKLASVKGKFDRLDNLILQIDNSVNDLTKNIDEQQAFLKKYFKKSKLGRKTMFRKITWMGIPLN